MVTPPPPLPPRNEEMVTEEKEGNPEGQPQLASSGLGWCFDTELAERAGDDGEVLGGNGPGIPVGSAA